MTNRLTKIEQNISLSKKVENQLREAILQKVYIPGERLPGEVELAETLGVSRTGIREAMRTLAGEGLIKINGRQGVFVSEIDIFSVVNPFTLLLKRKCGEGSHIRLIQIRLIIEPEIARMAAKYRTEDDLINLKNCFSEMEKEKENIDIMIQKDIDFHRLLASSTNNPLIPVMMDPIFHLFPDFMTDNYKLFRKQLGEKGDFFEHPVDEHQHLLRSIETQDQEKAFKTMKKHLATAEKHVLKYYKHVGFTDFE